MNGIFSMPDMATDLPRGLGLPMRMAGSLSDALLVDLVNAGGYYELHRIFGGAPDLAAALEAAKESARLEDSEVPMQERMLPEDERELLQTYARNAASEEAFEAAMQDSYRQRRRL